MSEFDRGHGPLMLLPTLLQLWLHPTAPCTHIGSLNSG